MRFNSIVSLASLAIAIASFYVSYQTKQLTMEEYISGKIEIPFGNINIDLSGPNLPSGTRIGVPFKFTLSNTGNRKLSIVKYDIFASSELGGKMWYSGIDGGLRDENGKPLQLPLTIDTGESRFGFVDIGILADSNAIKLLKSNTTALKITRRDMDKILANNGIDVFGNPVVLEKYGDVGISITGPGQNYKEQILTVIFQTGKGTTLPLTATWYPH